MKISGLKAGYAALNAADWVEGLPFALFDTMALKVRRPFTAEWSALAVQLKAEATDLSEADNDKRIERECLARVALTDWRGVDEPYAPELAIELLADAEVGPVFRQCVWYAIGRREAAVRAALERAEKN